MELMTACNREGTIFRRELKLLALLHLSILFLVLSQFSQIFINLCLIFKLFRFSNLDLDFFRDLAFRGF